MSTNKSKRIFLRETKYPIFLLGLLIMIGGGLAVHVMGLSVKIEAGTVVLGFVLLFLGIVIE